MAEAFGYTGCRVIVYDADTGGTAADTKILSADPYGKMIAVARVVFKGQPPERFTVLIFAPEGLYTYMGALRKTGVGAGLAEMALYGGRLKEDREALRYALNAIATIESVGVGQDQVLLPKVVEVLVMNMSPIGCLMRSHVASFGVGATFELGLEFEGTVTQIPARVVRMNILDEQMADYGCEFLVANTQWVEMDMEKHRIAPAGAAVL